MALANVSVILAKWGYRVLVVDWDLEAPGLGYFFKNYVNPDEYQYMREQAGIVDLLIQYLGENSSSLDYVAAPFNVESVNNNPIHFISAGRREGDRSQYLSKVRQLDVSDFYQHKRGGLFIEELRNKWREDYDFVLIDSRTGITDIGGICTIQLPDKLVMLFVANKQNVNGTVDVFRRVKEARYELPFDRQALVSVPIATRFEITEYKLSQEWLDLINEAMEPLYSNWLPKKVESKTMLERTRIPYIPYFGFGEKLPVIEQGTDDQLSLGYSYESLAALLGNNLTDVDQFTRRRDTYLEAARKKEVSVFISYSRKDRDFVTMLSEDLRKKGINVWIDSSIAGGESWRSTITENLVKASDVVVVLSFSAAASSWVQQEISIAYSRDKKMIPVLIDDLPPNEIPISLQDFQLIDFRQTPYELAFRRLLTSLQG